MKIKVNVGVLFLFVIIASLFLIQNVRAEIVNSQDAFLKDVVLSETACTSEYNLTKEYSLALGGEKIYLCEVLSGFVEGGKYLEKAYIVEGNCKPDHTERSLLTFTRGTTSILVRLCLQKTVSVGGERFLNEVILSESGCSDQNSFESSGAFLDANSKEITVCVKSGIAPGEPPAPVKSETEVEETKTETETTTETSTDTNTEEKDMECKGYTFKGKEGDCNTCTSLGMAGSETGTNRCAKQNLICRGSKAGDCGAAAGLFGCKDCALCCEAKEGETVPEATASGGPDLVKGAIGLIAVVAIVFVMMSMGGGLGGMMKMLPFLSVFQSLGGGLFGGKK